MQFLKVLKVGFENWRSGSPPRPVNLMSAVTAPVNWHLMKSLLPAP